MGAVTTPCGRIGVAERENDSGRTPIVFLHGVGSDKSVWKPQLDRFGQSRRVLAFDYPGYGDSGPAPEEATRDDFAAAIVAAMDALGVERAHVCGLSLGGVVAIAMHAAAPQRCASLILADTFALHPDGQGIYDRSVAAIQNGSMRQLAEARVDILLAQPADPAVRQEVIETMSRIDPAAYLTGAEAVWRADQSERAHDIRVPALVLCGELDKVTPPQLSRELHRMVPGSQLRLIEGAGHLGNIERPAEFNEAVEAFVRGVDSRPG